MTPWSLCERGSELFQLGKCMALLLSLWGSGSVGSVEDIWIDPTTLRALPQSGPAWEALEERALLPAGAPDLSDQNSAVNVNVLAKALYYARTGAEPQRLEVIEALRSVRGSEAGATALAVGRELVSYVIAADLIGLEGGERRAFEAWLYRMQRLSFDGRTLRSTHEDRPNNWGTHAGASRIAVAAYLGDQTELDRAAQVFRSWLGDGTQWSGFRFGERWWQPPGSRNYGVNPPGAEREGHSIDGVLPDDQRRGGEFRWPPPQENYVYEALQGALTQAQLLHRQGYPAWEWGDKALLRAFTWLHDQAGYPASGDDSWQPHLINHMYGTRFPASSPAAPGKGMGFTDWTHALP